MRLRRRYTTTRDPETGTKRRKLLPHWYTDVVVRRPDGTPRRIQKSTGCTDRQAAEAVARQWERDATRDPADRARESATLDAALKLLAAHLAAERRARETARATDPHARAGMSAATASFYTKKAGHLVRVLGRDLPLRELTTGRMREYWQTRQAEGASGHTIDKEHATLRIALHLATERGLWSGDLRTLKPAGLGADYQPRRRWLRRAELDQLAEQLPPHRWAVVAFACATGAELSALVRAERLDVDLARGFVLVRGDKTAQRRRFVPIVLDECAELLRRALDQADGRGGLMFSRWQNMRRDLAQACDRAKIPRASANDLRRTFAQWHHNAGVTNDVLKDAMGHSTTAMLDRVYARTNPAELAELMRAQIGKGKP